MIEDVPSELHEVQIARTAIETLLSDGEVFAGRLLLNCGVTYEYVDAWNFGPKEYRSVSVTLYGPPIVCDMLRGLKGLTGSRLYEDNVLFVMHEDQAHSAKVIRDALDLAIDAILPDSSLDAVWIRQDEPLPVEP